MGINKHNTVGNLVRCTCKVQFLFNTVLCLIVVWQNSTDVCLGQVLLQVSCTTVLSFSETSRLAAMMDVGRGMSQ